MLQRISEESRETYSTLSNIMNPFSNYKYYHRVFNSSMQHKIPWLGVLIEDITLYDVCEPDMIHDKINFEKFDFFATAIRSHLLVLTKISLHFLQNTKFLLDKKQQIDVQTK